MGGEELAYLSKQARGAGPGAGHEDPRCWRAGLHREMAEGPQKGDGVLEQGLGHQGSRREMVEKAAWTSWYVPSATGVNTSFFFY